MIARLVLHRFVRETGTPADEDEFDVM
jgi:hypothetical protein